MNALFDQAAVDFQLLFARAAHADAAFDTFQVRPQAFQARQRILQLRQLDGQPRFVGLCAAGKDVENQLGAIEHLDADRLLQIACLAGSQIVIEDHHVGIGGGGQSLQLFDFAAAKISGHVGRFALLGQRADHAGPGRGCQAFQFFQRVFLG